MKWLGQRGRRDLAERLDVERAASRDVRDSAAYLRGAGARVRAAQVDVALLRRRERRAALGAVRRHHELALGAVAQFDHRAEHLGDDIAGLAQHDGVADEHALELDDVLVVQGRLPNLGARHPHLLHDGERRRAPGAPDRDDDVEQLGVHLLGRVLVGDRPARGAARGAELVVQSELVDLDDDAVDLVLDRLIFRALAVLAVVLDELGGLLGGIDHAVVRARRQTPALQQLVDLRLARHRRIRGQAPMPCTSILRCLMRLCIRSTCGADLPSSFWRRDPDAAFRGFAKMRSPASAWAALSFSNASTGKNTSPRTSTSGGGASVASLEGMRGDVLHVVGDVLADDAVAAGRRADEHAVLVAEVHGEAVDLELAQVVHVPAGGAFDAGRPGEELLAAEHVVEAQHPLGVDDRVEQGRLGTAADRLGGRVLALQFGEQTLQLFEPVDHPVVDLVALQHRVALVVRLAQLEDATGQLIGFLFRLGEPGIRLVGNLFDGLGRLTPRATRSA